MFWTIHFVEPLFICRITRRFYGRKHGMKTENSKSQTSFVCLRHAAATQDLYNIFGRSAVVCKRHRRASYATSCNINALGSGNQLLESRNDWSGMIKHALRCTRAWLTYLCHHWPMGSISGSLQYTNSRGGKPVRSITAVRTVWSEL